MHALQGGPRVLLRRLREIMAEPISQQERLDEIVVLIAANMVAEVCSTYILRDDNVLELFATEGLKREAVHKIGLRVGQGLVGLIAAQAKPLNLPDAKSHPAFAYLPETGEELYSTFLGVPILRDGRTIGVLVVQNKVSRDYGEEEVEALQTTAMVIAEMIAVGGFDGDQVKGTRLDITRPHHLKGIGLVDGVGMGVVVLHNPRVVVTQLIADDSELEHGRLDDALSNMRNSVESMISSNDVSHGGEHQEVLEAYRMFTHDRGWAARIHEAIDTGLTAGAAVERVQSDYRARMQRHSDPYLRERLHEFDDLANRLLRSLVGDGAHGTDLPEDAILIARNMGAAELLDYDRSRLRGLVLEEGGPSSHIAIVARALGLATVGRVRDMVSLAERGDEIIVDGEAGEIHLRPPMDVQESYAEKIRLRARRQEEYTAIRNTPSLSADGKLISLNINAGLLIDMPALETSGADGVGLFRTELQFMVASKMPTIAEQEKLYRDVLDQAHGKPVIFRTLDVGGDKVLPYLRSIPEENPALGWRAIRFGLDRPGLLRLQLRALFRAANGNAISLMFPMVTDVEELQRARDLVDRELTQLRRHGRTLPKVVHLGVMIEVPSLLWQLDKIFSLVDFISIGSNDLLQFVTAADRNNPAVSSRFDPLSVSTLRMMRQLFEQAKNNNVRYSICGEMAGHRLSTLGLLAVGFRTLSMAPTSVGPIKLMILGLDIERLEQKILPLLEESPDPVDIRAALEQFVADENLNIGR